MNLTTVTGLKSEIYVPITPPAVFTPLTKPLAECVVALCTAGGVHLKSQPPFVLAGDHTFREIPATTPSSELMVSHGGFDNSDVTRDINAMLPLDRLRELAAEGCIGRIAPTLIGFMGGGGDVDRFRTETGPASPPSSLRRCRRSPDSRAHPASPRPMSRLVRTPASPATRRCSGRSSKIRCAPSRR